MNSIPLAPTAAAKKSRTFTWRAAAAFYSNRTAMGALTFLACIFTFAIFAPLLSSYTYYDINLIIKNQAPTAMHWLGTDDLGRDIFVRLWYGARISLFVGMAAAFVDLIIGILWGGVAALAGGKVDLVMMKLVDILSAIPSLLITISLMVVMGSGLYTIIVALSILGWITMARVVRAQILQLKTQDYVLAAHSLGASFSRILFRHLIPNAIGPILVTLTFTIPSAIFTEAFLSYLGLGVQAPIASWGTMASEGLPAVEYYPWRFFVPAGFISATMLAFNLLGDGLSDAFAEASRAR